MNYRLLAYTGVGGTNIIPEFYVAGEEPKQLTLGKRALSGIITPTRQSGIFNFQDLIKSVHSDGLWAEVADIESVDLLESAVKSKIKYLFERSM